MTQGKLSSSVALLSLGLFVFGANQASAVSTDTFTGNSLGEMPSSAQRTQNALPPDLSGAVGSNHIMEMSELGLSFYNKSGTHINITDGGVSLGDTVQLNTFWSKVLDQGLTERIENPRTLYDSASDRWYAVSIPQRNAAGSRVFVASSTGSDPTDLNNWEGAIIDPNDGDTGFGTAFPAVGMNADGLYIAVDMWKPDPETGNSTGWDHTNLIGVSKVANPAAGQSGLDFTNPAIKTTMNNIPSDTADPYTDFMNQPAVDLNHGSGSLPMLSANFNPSELKAGGHESTSVVIKQIAADFLTTPTKPSSTVLDATVTDRFQAPAAAQQGSSNELYANPPSFFSHVVKQGDSIWGIRGVKGGNNQAALEWMQFDVSDPSNPTLLQSNLIEDNDRDYYHGSLTVNEYGDVVIGFSASSNSEHASAYAVVGHSDSDGNTTFGSPILLKTGTDPFDLGQTSDTTTLYRWGDYTTTVLDPDDPFTFWTFTEYAEDKTSLSTGGDEYPSDDGNWGVAISKIDLKEQKQITGWTGPFNAPDCVTVHNGAGSNIGTAVDGNYTIRCLTVSGATHDMTLNINNPTYGLNVIQDTTIKDHGILNVDNGSFASGSLTIETGGEARFAIDSVTIETDVVNDGSLDLGDNDAGQVLSMDNFTQGTVGELVISLDANDAEDQLVVTGDAVLSGNLVLDYVSAGTPSHDEEWEILDVGGLVTGEFNTIDWGGHIIIDEVRYGLAVTYPDEQENAGGPLKAGYNDNKVHVAVALLGDANLDGTVSLLDLDIFGVNFGQPGSWAQGDFNGDGQVTLLDLDAIGTNFGKSEPGGSPAPEPASLALLAIGTVALGRRRRA